MSVLIAGGHRILSHEIGKHVLQAGRPLRIHIINKHQEIYLRPLLQPHIRTGQNLFSASMEFKNPLYFVPLKLNEATEGKMEVVLGGVTTAVWVGERAIPDHEKIYTKELAAFTKFYESCHSSKRINNVIVVSDIAAVQEPLPWWNDREKEHWNFLREQRQEEHQAKLAIEKAIYKTREHFGDPQKNFRTFIIKVPELRLVPPRHHDITVSKPSVRASTSFADLGKLLGDVVLNEIPIERGTRPLGADKKDKNPTNKLGNGIYTIYFNDIQGKPATKDTKLITKALKDPESGIQDWWYDEETNFLENELFGIKYTSKEEKTETALSIQIANTVTLVDSTQPLPKAPFKLPFKNRTFGESKSTESRQRRR